MEECDTNIVSLISRLCNSLLETREVETTLVSNKPIVLSKLMLDLIFKFTKGDHFKNFIDDLIPRIRMKISLQSPTDENTVELNRFNDCLTSLEDLETQCSDEIYSILLCLYMLSKFNSKKSSSNLICTERSESKLYKDSFTFNDINWGVFSKEPAAFKSTYSSFNTNFGAGLLFCEDHNSGLEFMDDLFRALQGKYLRWNFELDKPVQVLTQDEGFVTPGSDFIDQRSKDSDDENSDTISTASDDSLIFQTELLLRDRLTWENLGNNHPPREPPFASERLESIIHLWNIWNSVRKLMTVTPTLGPEKSFEDLKTDIIHLLFGVASDSFYFDSVYKRLQIRNGLHFKTITPECLASFCESFVECGSSFCRLKHFVEERSKLPFGPVHEAFCECIKGILQIHRFCLLNMNWNKIQTLSELELVMVPFRQKLVFLTNFCFINENENFIGTTFPSRIQLLDYLYDNITKIVTSDFQNLVFYFFENCCNVYLKIVSEWIFNGCFSNPNNYEEFFIYIQRELEIFWDWRRIGYIRVKEKDIPKFLEKYYKDIFVCGRSVNLLKSFSRKEISEKILPTSYPLMKCCFNAEQLDIYENTWKQFQKNFYKKYKWKVKMKDKFVNAYSTEFYKKIQDTRKKWFEAYNDEHKFIKLNISEYSMPNLTAEVALPKSDTNSITILRNESVILDNKDDNLEATDIPLKKSSIEDVNEMKIRNDGSGDASSKSICDDVTVSKTDENRLLRTRLTLTLPSPPFLHDGSGDAAVLKNKNQTECEYNRLKSIASDYQDQLSTTINKGSVSIHRMISTPMSACAQNRLKNMSSTLQESSIEYSEPKKTFLTDCMKNKLKVMSSEYHQRLSISNIDQSSETIEKSIPRILNDNEKNKLRVMSSEYHVRLNTLADQEQFIENKLSCKNKSNEQELNKQKDRQPLKPTYSDQKTSDVVGKNRTSYEPEINVSIVETETTAEELSEPMVTVIENPEKKGTNHSEQGFKAEVQNHRVEKKKYCFGIEEYRKAVFKDPLVKTPNDLIRSTSNVKNVDITSFFYYLAPSITIPLKIQSQLVNEAILWIFIEQEHYLEHLTTLRNYLLLRKPEFSLLLTNNIFEGLENAKESSAFLNSYTLASILRRALLASNIKKSFKFERNLALDVDETIPDSLKPKDIQVLRCISMSYNVAWPINVLITEPLIKKYSRIFRFLLQFQRTLWATKSDFRELKNLKFGKSIQFRQILLYRHNMLQTVRIIQDYITRQALERCWCDLISHLIHTEIDLDELYMSHLKYINKIIQRCFLCEESIYCHRAILNLLSSVLNYHDALNSGSWQKSTECNLLFHTNYTVIHSVYLEFVKNLNDIKSILKVLIYRKQKVYFEPLYLELCNYKKNESEM